MDKKSNLKIGLALQHIAMSVDNETLAKIKPWLNQVEQVVANDNSLCFSDVEGATQGEVLEKVLRQVFPKTLVIWEANQSNKTIKPIFTEEWFNSPFRKEQE